MGVLCLDNHLKGVTGGFGLVSPVSNPVHGCRNEIFDALEGLPLWHWVVVNRSHHSYFFDTFLR